MSRAKGLYRILVLDRYKSYESIEFQDYYKSYNIITLGLPSHSFYLTQPLDVGCFSMLKRLYSRQIKVLIKAYIYYITKIEFFIAFKTVYP
jgi:DDE superfamily endonuclease